MLAKIYHVALSKAARNELEEFIQKRKSTTQKWKRSKILLAADRGGSKKWDDGQIANQYEVNRRTIERLGQRYVLEGLEVALNGKPRLNLDKKKFDGGVEAKLIVLRCSEPKLGRSSWTLRLLADEMVILDYVEDMSHESVRQILKKNEIKPWRVAEWVIPSADSAFVCAMEEVLDVYARPYDAKNPVVCYDESPKQLVSEVRASYIDDKGVKHEDSEYKREGAAELVMITEPLGGQRQVLVQDDHAGITWAKNMKYIAEDLYADAECITVFQDNLSSHRKHNLYKVYPAAQARAIINKLDFVYTPKHGSWLNIAECELSVLSPQALKARFDSKQALEQQVQAWKQNRNEQQKGVDWQFTTQNARIKLKKLYPTILN